MVDRRGLLLGVTEPFVALLIWRSSLNCHSFVVTYLVKISSEIKLCCGSVELLVIYKTSCLFKKDMSVFKLLIIIERSFIYEQQVNICIIDEVM